MCKTFLTFPIFRDILTFIYLVDFKHKLLFCRPTLWWGEMNLPGRYFLVGSPEMNLIGRYFLVGSLGASWLIRQSLGLNLEFVIYFEDKQRKIPE